MNDILVVLHGNFVVVADIFYKRNWRKSGILRQQGFILIQVEIEQIETEGQATCNRQEEEY